MARPRIQPADVQRWRELLAQALYLLDEVEVILREREDGRRRFATKAAEALEKRLREVETYNHGGCQTCHEAEARAFLVKLQRIARE
jgi:hypothetical protein